MKKVILIFLFFSGLIKAQLPEFGQAKGLFMAIGIGPRFPISSFSENQNLGIGFNFTFSYTDNELLPVFLYSSIGYQHYPGRQDFYKISDYASFSSNVIDVKFGVRYFFPPIADDIVLLMPVAEIGPSFSYFYQF